MAVIQFWIQILDLFFTFLITAEDGFQEIYHHFSYSHRSVFVTFGEVTDAGDMTSLQHLWERSGRHFVTASSRAGRLPRTLSTTLV